MIEENRKIMILNYDSEATEKVRDIFPENCDVTTSDSLKDISEKADEDFDIIITGYVVPAVSGDRTWSYLQNIQKALDEAKSAMQGKRDANEALMRETQEKQDNILEMLNDHVRGVESEVAVLKTKMESMTEETEAARKSKEEAIEKAEAAFKEKAEAEKKAEEALKEKARTEEEFDKIREDDVKAIASLEKDVITLREELEKSISLAEQAYAEKGVIEEKLAKLQENWEKYMEGQ
ncbi:MAG: hypothetical protein JRI95_12660 [Deltaproteobacteria bacterium]|nr:hypothetical protein [Deltaproteobacteria bacterium]